MSNPPSSSEAPPGPTPSPAPNPTNSPLPRLGPAWSYSRTAPGHHRPYQPPPPNNPFSSDKKDTLPPSTTTGGAASTPSDLRARSSSFGEKSNNSFSALSMDDDDDEKKRKTLNSAAQPRFSRRSESGKTGRSLADLAAASSGGGLNRTRGDGLRQDYRHHHSSHADPTGGPGRYDKLGSGRGGFGSPGPNAVSGPGPSAGGGGGGISISSSSGIAIGGGVERDKEEEKKVIRYTRERLLSLRPAPTITLLDGLKLLEGTVILTKDPQEPVCFDDFDPDEIWAAAVPTQPPRRVPNPTIPITTKPPPVATTPSLPRGPNEHPAHPHHPNGSGGRWQRGQALPPPSATPNQTPHWEVQNPEDLWDDPNTNSAASDFSAFGAMPPDVAPDRFDLADMHDASKRFEVEFLQRNSTPDDELAVEEEEDVSSQVELDSNGEEKEAHEVKVDPKKPLASKGMTIRSGSGDNVNVFEDFGCPHVEEAAAPVATVETTTQEETAKTTGATVSEDGEEKQVPIDEDDPSPNVSATSRLMRMIGVDSNAISSDAATSKLMTSWGVRGGAVEVASVEDNSVKSGDVIDHRGFPGMGIGGFIAASSATTNTTSVSRNPWADNNSIISSDNSANENTDLSAQLKTTLLMEQQKAATEAATEEQQQQQQHQQRHLEAEKHQKQLAEKQQAEQQHQEQLALQRQRSDQQEKERQAAAAQVAAQAALQAQMEAQARQADIQRQNAEAQRAAAARSNQNQQQQGRAAAVQYNSQVENILMERITAILENSWGRSDLMTILSALHGEDQRVIPLLGTIDALHALIARHPERIALTKDPSFGVNVVILRMTNAQYQQHKVNEERMRREREQQEQQMQVQQARARAEAEARAKAAKELQEKMANAVVVTNDPWFYTDPQGRIQGPFGGEEMRQWLDAGYFKGDLPISQNPNGQFRLLSTLFPDPSVAFQPHAPPEPEISSPSIDVTLELEQEKQDKLARAEEEARIKAEEEAAKELAKHEETQMKARADAAAAKQQAIAEQIQKEQEARLRAEQEATAKEQERKQAAAKAKAAKKANSSKASSPSALSSDQNASNQLKMLLGLGGASSNHSNSPLDSQGGIIVAGPPPKQKNKTQSVTKPESIVYPPSPPTPSQAPSNTIASSQPTPVTTQPTQITPVNDYAAPSSTKQKQPTPHPTAPAWGGVSTTAHTKRKIKSMSEIQQEEARIAAKLEKQRVVTSRSNTSGWANVAAGGGGSTGWSSGTIKIKQASMIVPMQAPGAIPVRRANSAGKPGIGAVLASSQQIRRGSGGVPTQQGKGNSGATATANILDNFGANERMTPQLEGWCKDQMKKLNGSDDLTLVAFCMTLTDAGEIRQYLTAYLGTSAQVNSFATEFINRKGLGKKKDESEWESAGNAKKGRNRKKSTQNAPNAVSATR